MRRRRPLHRQPGISRDSLRLMLWAAIPITAGVLLWAGIFYVVYVIARFFS